MKFSRCFPCFRIFQLFLSRFHFCHALVPGGSKSEPKSKPTARLPTLQCPQPRLRRLLLTTIRIRKHHGARMGGLFSRRLKRILRICVVVRSGEPTRWLHRLIVENRVDVDHGAFGDDLGTLSVGGESIFSRGIVTVDSGSTMKWSSVNLMRSGELRITGSETRVRSIPQTAVPAPQVKVEGFGAHLSLNDGGQIGGSNFLLQGGGSASVFGTDSLLNALNHIGTGGTSSLSPQDSGTSIMSVGEGAMVFTPSSMPVSSGGALRLSGGLVSTPNHNVDGGGLRGGGQITGSVKIASGGQINPGIQMLWTNSVLFQTGSRFIASLSGRAAGTQYSQLDVTGATNINGAKLEVSESFTSAPGDDFVIIRKELSVSDFPTGLEHGPRLSARESSEGKSMSQFSTCDSSTSPIERDRNKTHLCS